MHIDKLTYRIQVLPYGERTDLLIITNNNDLLPKIQHRYCSKIRLTCFIDNDDIKLVFFGVELLQCCPNRHNPRRHRFLTL